jgi:hypothetical protein
MTRQDAKEKAKDLWDEWKWWLALVVFPLVVMAANKYDAQKLDTQVFNRYADHQEAQRVLREERIEARLEDLRREVRYGNCLGETKGSLRACAHLRSTMNERRP